MKNEYTVTFNAEVTAIMEADEKALDLLGSDLFKEANEATILNSRPDYHDVHIHNLKVFISKEDIDNENA